MPIGPKVAPLTVFTFKGLLIMLILSEILMNICWDMHEHVVPVSNRDVVVSVLKDLTAKFDNFNFAFSKLDIVMILLIETVI